MCPYAFYFWAMCTFFPLYRTILNPKIADSASQHYEILSPWWLVNSEPQIHSCLICLQKGLRVRSMSVVCFHLMFSILPSQLSRSFCCGQLKLSPQMLPCGRQSWGCVGRPLPGPRLIRDVPKGLSLPSSGNNIFWKLFFHTLFYHEGLILINSSLIFNLNSMFCQCTVPLIQVWFYSAFCDSQSKPYRLLIAKIRWMTIHKKILCWGELCI